MWSGPSGELRPTDVVSSRRVVVGTASFSRFEGIVFEPCTLLDVAAGRPFGLLVKTPAADRERLRTPEPRAPSGDSHHGRQLSSTSRGEFAPSERLYRADVDYDWLTSEVGGVCGV